MSDTDKFRDRALDVIEEVFGGEHHVFHLKWEGDGCKFLVNEQMATYDFSDLTRLVVACHDHCVRGEIRNGGPRMLRVILSPRERTHKHPDCCAHPTLEQHIAHLRSKAPNYQPLFNQLRKEDPQNAPTRIIP